MEREDGREEDANANAKWNGKNRGEGGGEEKVIAVVKVKTEGKGGDKGKAGREGAVVVIRGRWKGTRRN
jgi:hypothetical protein